MLSDNMLALEIINIAFWLPLIMLRFWPDIMQIFKNPTFDFL